MKSTNFRPIRVASSAVPAFAGALVGVVYLVGATVFSWASQTPAAGAAPAPRHQAVEVQSLRHFAPLGGQGGTALPPPVEVASAADPVPVLPDTAAPAPAPRAPRIAIVIDDVGPDRAAAARAIALTAPVSIAILPYADASAAVSADAATAGHDVLLHMPMEPLGLADPGPNALRAGLSDAGLQARMLWAMARVPEAIGLNNHMGSRFTRDPRALRVALSAIADRNPVFLDSLTTGDSRGHGVARGLGLRALERDVFLDHVVDAESIAARLHEAEALARRRGWAVAIGHPHETTLEILEAWMSQARARGIEFVGIAALSGELADAPADDLLASLVPPASAGGQP